MAQLKKQLYQLKQIGTEWYGRATHVKGFRTKDEARDWCDRHRSNVIASQPVPSLPITSTEDPLLKSKASIELSKRYLKWDQACARIKFQPAPTHRVQVLNANYDYIVAQLTGRGVEEVREKYSGTNILIEE